MLCQSIYGIKVRCYWDLFGGTCQELGNSLLWLSQPTQKKKEKKKRPHGKPTVKYPSGEWTVDTPLSNQTQVEKNKPPSAHAGPKNKKREAPSTPWGHFSLIAWKLLKLAGNYFWPTYGVTHHNNSSFVFCSSSSSWCCLWGTESEFHVATCAIGFG